jgi:hypothetical protein
MELTASMRDGWRSFAVGGDPSTAGLAAGGAGLMSLVPPQPRLEARFASTHHCVIHNYRSRIGLVDGEPRYETLERRLAEAPVMSVPTITLEGTPRRAAPRPQLLRGEVLGPALAPDHHRRHRPQPAPGGA